LKKIKDTQKITTGKEGERIATAYLKKNGYRIIEINFRCPIGEIDIVAKDKDDLVFVEVKTRKSIALGYPEEAVGIRKQKKMSQLALWYMQKRKIADISARFDVVSIILIPENNEVKLIKNAFDFITF
jgi:putative endonuclease